MTNPQNFAAHLEAFGLTAPPPAAPSAYTYVGGNNELDQLLMLEAQLYDQSKDVEKRLDEVKDRIKIALTSVSRAPGVPFERYRIALPGAVARVLRWKTSRRIDTPRLKKALPDVYAEYSRESGAWFLEREK